MAVPEKDLLFFITDVMKRSLYVDNNIVKKSALPTPLQKAPKEWQDTTLSFGTTFKYWSLDETFSVPMTFEDDGAFILREYIYGGKGYEEELYIMILKKNLDNGTYELEYIGRLDLSKKKNMPLTGITVSTTQGGLLTYLAANESVDYSIPLDASNAAAKQVVFDGINLFDRYHYSVVDLAFQATGGALLGHGQREGFTLAVPFINNEGDSVGIIQGSQTYERISTADVNMDSDIDSYCQTSANYIYSSISPVSLFISGNIHFNITEFAGPTLSFKLYFETSLGNKYILYDQTNLSSVTSLSIDATKAINLQSNEKLFLVAKYSLSSSAGHVYFSFITSDIFIAFSSITPPTSAYFLEPLDLLKQLVSLMTNGAYTADSNFFATKKNIVMSSTESIRNFDTFYYGPYQTISPDIIQIPGLITAPSIINANGISYNVLNTLTTPAGYTQLKVTPTVIDATFNGTIYILSSIKQSFVNFFNDYDCLYDLGMKIVNGVLWIEPKKDLYKDDVDILDLGEIANLDFIYADDLLVNTASFGYASQDYRQASGRYEYNTATISKLPVNSITAKNLTKVCKARGDALGIEFERAKIFDKTTQDSTGDNQKWLINVTLGINYIYYKGNFSTDAGSNSILIPGTLFSVPQIIISGAASNNGTFTITNTSYLLVGFTRFTVAEPVTTASLTGQINVNDPAKYGVTRKNYTSISGVPDNSVFNIEEMTPERMKLANGGYLHSLLYQLSAEKITFTSADKNAALVTTDSNGVTISEKQDDYVSNLLPAYFIPMYAEFNTPVPLSFAKVMSSIGTGYVTGTYNGNLLYFLPIGKMDAKIASNAAQQWKLMLSGKNNLDTIKLLSLPGIFTTDSMGNSIFTSDLNPFHLNKYNYQLPAKYKHKEIYDDVFHERLDNFISKPYYKQKIERNDPPYPIQCIVRGLGTIDVTVYDANANEVFTSPMNVGVEPAVQLPYIKFIYNLDFSNATTFPDGTYFVVLSASGVPLRISEYLEIKQTHDDTLLIEYSHTTSKWNTYFTDWPPQIRVEAMLLPWYPDSSFESYTDEVADVELLDGIPLAKRQLRTKYIPDWMALKLNRILLLNRTYIEGVRYSRTAESKFDKKEDVGYPMKSYLIEITQSVNHNGLSTDATGAEDDDTIVYTLDAQAFGSGNPGDVINIEVPNN